MGVAEKKATSFGARIKAWGQNVSQAVTRTATGVKKAGSDLSSGLDKAERSTSKMSKVAPGFIRGLTGMKLGILGAALAAAKLIKGLIDIAGQSDQARELGETWKKLKAQMVAPFVHFLAAAFSILNRVMSDPAVQRLIGWFADLARIVLSAVLPAISALAGAFQGFAAAVVSGDWANIFTRTWEGFVAGWNDAGKAGGVAAGASFNKAFEAEAAKAAGGGGGGKAAGGFLRKIGDLGTAAVDSLLSAFSKPDLDVLDQAAAAIKSRLETLFKRGDIAEVNIIPAQIAGENAVAFALAEANKAGADTEKIVARVRARLVTLGPAVQDYVENLIRAREAMRQLEAATADLEEVQSELTRAQAEFAAAQLRQAQEAAKLLPISDALRDNEQALQRLTIAQTADREKITSLAEEQEDAEREIARLQGEQAAKLAALKPLRDAVTAAAEAQAAAERKVRDAQDELIPLQDKLYEQNKAIAAAAEGVTAASAELADLQERIGEAQAARQEEISDLQQQIEEAVLTQEAALKQVAEHYARQIADQQKIVDDVDARWKREIDGATEAYRAAQRILALEDRRLRIANLQYARERLAAQGITDPNKRIAALAKINRAQEQYNDRTKDGYEVAQLAAQVAEEELKLKQEAVDAEKAEAVATIARLQEALEKEQKSAAERIASIREQGAIRLRDLQRANDEQTKIEQSAVKEAQARVEAAQAVQAAAQEQADATAASIEEGSRRIELLSREAEAARRTAEDARTLLEKREAAVLSETQGAIEAAEVRAKSLSDQRAEIEDRLGDEARALEERISREQNALALRKSELEEQAEIENRPLQARLDALGQEEAGAQKRVDDAQALVDKYTLVAELAQARAEAEARSAESIAAQRQVLDEMIAAAQAAGGGGAAAGPDLSGFNSELSKLIQGSKPLITDFWQGFIDELVKRNPDIVKAWDDLVARFSLSGLGTFLDELGKTGTWASFGGFEETFTDIENFLADPGKQFTKWWDDIGKQWEEFGKGEAATSFNNTLKGIGDSIGDSFSKVGTAFVWLWETLVGAWNGGTQFIGDAGAYIGDMAARLWQSLSQTWTDITQGAKNLWSDVTGWFKQIWDDLVGNSIVPDIVDDVMEWFGKLPGKLIEVGKKILDGATQPFKDAAKNIVGAGSAVGGFIGDIYKGVTGGFTDVKDDTGPLIKTFLDGAQDMFKGARDVVVGATGQGGVIQTVKEGVQSGFSAMKEQAVGTDGKSGLVGGLIAGVGSMFGLMKDEVAGPTNSKLAQLKSDAGTRLQEFKTEAETKTGEIKTSVTGNLATAQTEGSASFNTLKNDVVLVLTNLPGAIGPLLIAIMNAFKVVFGPKEQNGTILWMMTHGDQPNGNIAGGFFPMLEYWIRYYLDYQRNSVWVASFDALFGALKTFLDPEGHKAIELLGWVESLGTKIGEALAKGILSQKQATYDAGKAIVDSAKQGADDAAGNPQSPAPAFIPLGKQSGEGYEYGLLSMLRRIASAGRAMVTVAAAAASGGGSFGPMPMPALAGAAGRGAIGVSGIAGVAVAPLPSRAQAPVHTHIGVQHVHNNNPYTDLSEQERLGGLVR
jgi:hypothetical protein